MAQTRVPPPPRRLFTVLGVEVQADLSAPLSPLAMGMVCWLLVGWRYPTWGWLARLLLTCVWAGLFFLVFLLHGIGHIVSSRAADAPMDALLINAFHWITLYFDQNVAPGQHIGRAVGGPLANGLVIGLSGGLRRIVPPGPLGRDLVDVFLAFNAFIGGAALLPAPTFDGGALLKWSVYARTGDAQRASRAVQDAGLGAALGLTALAGWSFWRRWHLLASVLAAFGLVAALESLRRD